MPMHTERDAKEGGASRERKKHPVGVLRSLARVDRKDATIQNSKFHKIIQCFFDVFYFFFRES